MNQSHHITPTIKVSYDNIEKGERGCAHTCAVALAIKEACPHLIRVRVQPSINYLLKDGTEIHINANQDLRNYISNFDHGIINPYPIEISIDLENFQVTSIKEI